MISYEEQPTTFPVSLSGATGEQVLKELAIVMVWLVKKKLPKSFYRFTQLP